MLEEWKAHSTSNEGRTARRPQVLTDQFVGWNSRTFPATALAPQAVRPPRCCDKRETRVAAYGSQAQTTRFVPDTGTTQPMSQMGHRRTFRNVRAMSTFGGKADIERYSWNAVCVISGHQLRRLQVTSTAFSSLACCCQKFRLENFQKSLGCRHQRSFGKPKDTDATRHCRAQRLHRDRGSIRWRNS